MINMMFGYNIPAVMNNFFYLMFIALFLVAVIFGIYAAKQAKKREQYIPKDAEYEAFRAAKDAAKAAKKAGKKGSIPAGAPVESVEK